MKIEPVEPSLTVTFNKQELEYLRGLTQNYQGNPADETQFDKQTRMELFVAVSRALGYDMNPDGTIPRTQRKWNNDPRDDT